VDLEHHLLLRLTPSSSPVSLTDADEAIDFKADTLEARGEEVAATQTDDGFLEKTLCHIAIHYAVLLEIDCNKL